MSNPSTIVKTSKTCDLQIYLNHSCMSSLSFGAEEMAWTTNNLAEAEQMLARCIEKHQDTDRYTYDIETAYYSLDDNELEPPQFLDY